VKDPEHADNHAEITKWLRTHNTRDGRRRAQKARNKLREEDASRRKWAASGQMPEAYQRYKTNGPN
jgi:hypothetical protein